MAPDRTRAAAPAAIRTSPYTLRGASPMARGIGLAIPPSVLRRAMSSSNRPEGMLRSVVQSRL
jgi:hypothetical protein